MSGAGLVNFIFDGVDFLYVLQFERNETVFNKNLFVSCVKSIVSTQRVESEGEVDVTRLDQAPVLLLTTNLTTMTINIEVLCSNITPASLVEVSKGIAQAGPREYMSRVLPLYTAQLDQELKFKGTVMRFDNNQAALYNGEPQVSSEMELLVSYLFPEHEVKKI